MYAENIDQIMQAARKLEMISTRTQTTTVFQASEDFLSARSIYLSAHTVSDYALTMRRFQAFFGNDPPMDEIEPRHIRAFLATIPGGMKNRKNAYIGLSALWSFAVKEGYAAEHIIHRVEQPKAESRAILPIDQESVRRLFRAAAETGRNRERNRSILMILFDTGIRASELCEARIGDWEGDYLLVMGKGSKERALPISHPTAQGLRAYLSERRTALLRSPLVANEDETAFNRHYLRHLLMRLGERSGVPNVHPHRCRHTFAVNYLRNGGDPYTLQMILGHSTMEMVKRYLSLAREDVAAVHRKASPIANWDL